MNSTNLYIFLTDSIVKVGGAEIYVRNKCNYLKDTGWNVFIFSTDEGEIRIEDLKEYKPYIRKEFQIPPFAYSFEHRNQLIESIIALSNAYNPHKIVLESNSLRLSLWGELIAQQLHAKHLLFILEEKPMIRGKGLLDFLQFKYRRRELAGIAKESLQLLFAPYFKISADESYFLPAYCTNPIEDIECSWLRDIPDADFCLASFGRLEKPYLQTVLTDMEEFISSHTSKTFNLIFIGGERTGFSVQNQIKRMFSKYPNVYVLITGFLFPVPLSLIRRVDVFLSSAGSASATNQLGIPTISYDTIDKQPIGIMGKTTKHSLFREDEPKVKGCDLLQEILIENKYEFTIVPFVKRKPDYSLHMIFLERSENVLEYFDFSNYKLGRIENFKMLVYKLGGYWGYEKVKKYYTKRRRNKI